MQPILTWLNKNKVFLFGLAQFLFASLNEIFSGTDATYTPWILGYSGVIAILTYLGRNLRGQWASICSAVLPTVYVIGSLHNDHVPLTLAIVSTKILFPLFGAIVGIFFTSPPKDREYEHTAVIVEAKAEAAATKQEKIDIKNAQ